MKIQALLIALAMAASGSVFAASDTDSAARKPVARHGMAHKAKTAKAKHKPTHHASAARHHGGTQHMGASGQHMNSAIASPQTDLQSRERQTRIDQAYNDWRAGRS